MRVGRIGNHLERAARLVGNGFLWTSVLAERTNTSPRKPGNVATDVMLVFGNRHGATLLSCVLHHFDDASVWNVVEISYPTTHRCGLRFGGGWIAS